MAPEMSQQTPAIPPNTLTESSDEEMYEAISYINQVKVRFVDSPDTYNTFIRVLMDHKRQAMNNVDAVNRISELFAGHPDLLQGFEIFVPQGNRIECGSSNEPNTICATGDPIATNSNNDAMYSNPLLESDTGTPELVQGVNQLLLANTGSSVETIVHKQTDTSVSVLATLGNDQDVLASSNNIIRDEIMKYKNDVKGALDKQRIEISQINTRASEILSGHPQILGPECQANYDPDSASVASCPVLGMPAPPMTMFLSVQPPGLSRQVVLYPPPVVQVLNATMDLEDVSAFASLYRDDGTNATKFLEGNMKGSYSNGKFRFPDLKISKNGSFELKIILWHQDNYVGYVDSTVIVVGDRLLQTNPITRENQHTKRQLHWQDIGGNVKDDDNGLFPNWNCQIHTGSSVIRLQDIKCAKIMVLIPKSAFARGKFDDGLYEITGGLGNGLFTDNCEVWYDDGEVERAAHNLGLSIHCGTDGELYRREPVFDGLFVALERRVVWIGGAIYVAHIVLLETAYS